MSCSGNSSSTHLAHSLAPSKARSVATDTTHAKHTLNILFIGETTLGGRSVVDLIADSRGQKRTRLFNGSPGYDVRTVTLGDGDTFRLHTASQSGRGIQNTMSNIQGNGGIHLLVYCIDVSLPTSWISEIYRSIPAYSVQTPAVAVVGGTPDEDWQEGWWSTNKDALTKDGPRFIDHTFIRISSGQLGPRDTVPDNCHALRTFILRNCTRDSELHSDSRCTTPFKPLTRANTIRSFLAILSGKNSVTASSDSKVINIVLLGETGVGKSSLINLIAKADIAKVSSDAMACTKTTAMYPIEEGGRTFHLHDTPGLVDPKMEDYVGSVATIHELIRSLGNGAGPDLLLFCVGNSKPTTSLQRDYRLFCQIICGGKVPCALAITKLEEGQDAGQWWHQHYATIRDYHITFSGYIGLRRERGRVGANPHMEGQSRESLLSFCVKQTKGRKDILDSVHSWMTRLFESAATLLHFRETAPRLERILMDKCELNGRTARELADRLIPPLQSGGENARA